MEIQLYNEKTRGKSFYLNANKILSFTINFCDSPAGSDTRNILNKECDISRWRHSSYDLHS